MTMRHAADNILNVKLHGRAEPIGVTTLHRVFSEDRGAFVMASELRAGERVRTQTGSAAVESISDHRAVEEVYNLEVETEHVYFVSGDKVLVHNQCSTGGAGPVLKGQQGAAKMEQDIVAAGGTIKGKEVTFDTTGGRVRADVVYENAQGQLRLGDAKFGPNAGLTKNQTTGYPAMSTGGGTPRGANAAKAGFTPGVPAPAMPVDIFKY